jgi:hypothetical protein
MSTNKSRPSVGQLREAFESFDWPTAKSLLEACKGGASTLEEAEEALRRAGKLIYEYPAPGLEKKRATLFKSLTAYFANGEQEGEIPEELNIVLETIQIAEYGYRQLVSVLSQTEAAKLLPAVHVAAGIRRAEMEVQHLLTELEKTAKGQAFVTPHIRLPMDDGQSANPDAALEHIVTFAAMTIQMEAFKNKWVSEEGFIVIPAPPQINEDDVYKVGSTILLATIWKRWKQTEQRARLLGRRLRFLTEDERPIGTPLTIKTLIVHESRRSLELIHRVAAERMNDKLNQNLLEIMADPSINEVLQRGDKHLLPPHGFISHDEIGAGHAISETLSYNIFADKERPGGLLLVEWIRGYCVLKELAKIAKTDDLVKSKSDWQHIFSAYGLDSDASNILIDHLTFNRSSRDLFDQPILKRQDGMYQIFVPAFASMSVSMVVLSALSNLGVQFQKKGKGFESKVRETFNLAGLPSYSFKVNRDGSEYEYDAVVPWGDYLFVFECKNRSLPNGNPVQEHYFDLENRDNIKQLHRLMEALVKYPDILVEKLPVNAAKKTLVPILLNCLPYAIPGKVAGVYFYDYSALSRFFKNGQISGQSMKLGLGATQVMRGPRIWSDERPTAEDFIAQLEEPIQFKVVRDALVINESGFQLPFDGWVFSNDFQRVPSTMMSPKAQNQ